MSYLSDLVRAATGRSVGENIGGAIGGAIGGPGGAVIGAKIGGTTTRIIDRDRGQQQGQATAIDVAAEPPRETASSGEIGLQRGMMPGVQPAVYTVPSTPAGPRASNVGLPAIVSGGTAVARSMGGVAGMLGLAGGAIAVAPIIIDPFTGEEKKLRVTRRLRSQVKKAVEMFGIEFVAEQMGTDVEVIVYILTKKMRNDGPYVTKAAVRKTRQTVRKMKHLCDMYDDLRPSAKRRAPVRRAAATRITNVK